MSLALATQSARRSLVKHPLFSAVVILTLGLAIGANSAIFNVIDAALLRPADLRDADRFVNIYTGDSTGQKFESSSYPDYAYLRDNARGFDGVIGHSGLMATLTSGQPEVVFGEIVTGNYFAVTGAPIAVGRGFTADEDRTPGANPVVVISDRRWRRRFNADPAILGKPITINGHSFTVIGVAAPSFTGLLFRGLNAELWAPVMMMGQLRTNQLDNRAERWMFVKARLAPGTTREQATHTLATAGVALAERFPETNRGRTFVARSTSDVMVNPDGDRAIFPAVLLLLAAVGFVVLIAATNVANLMFARAANREREIAVRLSLGASRRQIIAQLMAESGLLAALGGTLGLALAVLLSRILTSYRPPVPVPISFHVGVDARVVWFTIALTTLTALVCGLIPALQASRPSLTTSLSGARVMNGKRSAVMRLRRAFLVPQLTLSLVLLVVAGLFARSVLRAGAVDTGFDMNHTAVLALNLELDGYDSTRAQRFYTDLARRVEGSGPGRSVTVTNRIPLDLYGSQSMSVSIAGLTSKTSPVVQIAGVDSRYFDALGVALIRGRAFTDAEVRSQAPVVVISEAMAQRYWPSRPALGETIRDDAGRALTVVGVARDAKVQTLGEAPQPLLYQPLPQDYARLLRLVVRSTESPSIVASQLRREVAALDPNVAIFESGALSNQLGLMLFPYRAAAIASAMLGLFGLLISSIGLFGVVAFSVARRTRELGIRIALGATPRMIVNMVVAEQTKVIALSIVIGLALGLGAARALASLVFGISWSDPVTLVGVVSSLSGVALLATYLPAARATRISPAVALREE